MKDLIYKSSKVPVEIKKFLFRIIVLFLVWKLTYHFFIKPNRYLDKPLTYIVATQTKWVLEKIYPSSNFVIIENPLVYGNDFYSLKINKDNHKVVGIADPCNALELFLLYIAFILSFPATYKKSILFIGIGSICIHFLNIIRVVVISYLNITRSANIDIAHHYVFKIIMYTFIFVGWMYYVKNSSINNEQEIIN